MYKALWKNDVLFDDTGEALARIHQGCVVLAHSQIQVSIERRFPTGVVVRGESSSGQRYMLTNAGLSVHRLKVRCGEALYHLDRSSVLSTHRQIVRAGEEIGTLAFSRTGTGQIVLEQRLPTEFLAFLSYACRLIDAPREVRS